MIIAKAQIHIGVKKTKNEGRGMVRLNYGVMLATIRKFQIVQN